MTENLDNAVRTASLPSPQRQDEIAKFVLVAVAADWPTAFSSAGQVREVAARLLEDDEGVSLEQAKREVAGW